MSDPNEDPTGRPLVGAYEAEQHLTTAQIAAALDGGPDPEIAAMSACLDALFPLEVKVQRRVLRWLGERFEATEDKT